MKKITGAYFVACMLLIISIWCGAAIGSVHIPFEILWNQAVDETVTNIFWKIRLPRVLLAGLVGASLAIAEVRFPRIIKKSIS